MRGDRDQALAQASDALAQGAVELRQGLRQRAFAARRDDIGHRFDRGQVDPAVEKGAPAEFSALRDPRPLVQREADHPPHQKRPAMALQLHHVLAGQTAGRAHHHCQRAID